MKVTSLFFQSLYSALRRSKWLIIAVSKDFLKDDMLTYFVKNHVVHRIIQKYYHQENVVFVLLDDVEIPDNLLANFTSSQQLKWSALSFYKKRQFLLKILMPDSFIARMTIMIYCDLYLLSIHKIHVAYGVGCSAANIFPLKDLYTMSLCYTFVLLPGLFFQERKQTMCSQEIFRLMFFIVTFMLVYKSLLYMLFIVLTT